MLKDYQFEMVSWDHRAIGFAEDIQEKIMKVWNNVQLRTGRKPTKPICITEVPFAYHGSDMIHLIVSEGPLTKEEAIAVYERIMDEIRNDSGREEE